MGTLSSHLKHFEVSVSQLKKSNCLRLAKKSSILDFSQSLTFTIDNPYLGSVAANLLHWTGTL